MKRLLIIGGSGFLGRRLAYDLARAFEVMRTCCGTCRGGDVHFDLTVAHAAKRLLAVTAPDVIIHCGGIVDVDACETDPKRAWAVNVEGTRMLLASASAKVVYVSTDYVFDGTCAQYSPNDAPAPLNVYGATKEAAERDVLSARHDNVVVRVAGLYGRVPGHDRYRSLLSRDHVTARVDQYSTPLYVNDFARNMPHILEARGIVHLVGEERISRYAFLTAIIAAAGARTVVHEARCDTDSRPARRPHDTSLQKTGCFVTTPFDVSLRCFSGLGTQVRESVDG